MPSLFLLFFFLFLLESRPMCSEHFGMRTISWGKRWRGGSRKCWTGALMLPRAATAAAAAWTCTSGRLSLGDKETQVCCPACRTWSGGCRITPHLTLKQSQEGEGCRRGRGLGGEDVFLVGCILTLCKYASLLSALCKSGSRYGLCLSFSLKGVGCVMKFTLTGRRFEGIVLAS